MILFATLHPYNCLGGWAVCISLQIYFGRTLAEEVWSMSRNQNWSLLRRNNSKSIWRISNTFKQFQTNFWDPIVLELSHSQNPHHSKTYVQHLATNTETHLIVWQSWGNLFHFSQKGPHFVIFKELKAVWRKNYHCKPQVFCLEIWKAVCLSFDWVPKLIQISFQTIEQKLVQRCDTKVDADACKASYLYIYMVGSL